MEDEEVTECLQMYFVYMINPKSYTRTKEPNRIHGNKLKKQEN